MSRRTGPGPYEMTARQWCDEQTRIFRLGEVDRAMATRITNLLAKHRYATVEEAICYETWDGIKHWRGAGAGVLETMKRVVRAQMEIDSNARQA